MGRITAKSGAINAVLDLLALGAIVGTVLVAPNLAQVLGKALQKRGNREVQPKEAQAILQYMKRQGMVEIVKSDDEFTIAITNRGRERLTRHRFDALEVPSPEKWDGKWRMVMFDIPQEEDATRKAMTLKLQNMGFKLLQRSVWVHPFPCRKEIEVLLAVYPEVASYVVIGEVDNLNAHDNLKKLFAELLNI